MALAITVRDANEVFVSWVGLSLPSSDYNLYRSETDYTSSPGSHIDDMDDLGDVTGESTFTDYTTVRGKTYYYYLKYVDDDDATAWETGTCSTANKPGEILPSNVEPHSFMATTSTDVFINMQNGYGKHTTNIDLESGNYTLVLIKSTSTINDAEMAKILDGTTTTTHNTDTFRIITSGAVNAVTGYDSKITVTDHVTYEQTGD